MYTAKINAVNNTITICKLFLSKSNIKDYNWIFNNNMNFKYKTCKCFDINECVTKNIKELSLDKKNKVFYNIEKIKTNIERINFKK
tara:strand:- start:100 stop:357 length:258 start_codon:yes stop_codon:yes gene_type:complete